MLFLKGVNLLGNQAGGVPSYAADHNSRGGSSVFYANPVISQRAEISPQMEQRISSSLLRGMCSPIAAGSSTFFFFLIPSQ